MRDYEQFIGVFDECAPPGASLTLSGDGVVTATIECAGEVFKPSRMLPDPIRHIPGNAASLADDCWRFLEACDARRKIAEIEDRRKSEDIELEWLRRRAAR